MKPIKLEKNGYGLPEPYPCFVEGTVVKGFGRGSKELGCPTANIESEIVHMVNIPNGIYYGLAQLKETPDDDEDEWSTLPVYMMSCSFGYNPHYGNNSKSLEVHILNQFDHDFYGAKLRIAICGKIREELKFPSLDHLIQQIRDDNDFARKSLSDEEKFRGIKDHLKNL